MDSSAVVAVVLAEPSADGMVEAIAVDGVRGIGTPTLAEAAVVLGSRLGVAAQSHLRRFLAAFDVDEVPFVDAHWPLALDAFLRFGKGRHPAALNFGDCLTYAVARLADEPLLCVGDDFPQTDLAVIVP